MPLIVRVGSTTPSRHSQTKRFRDGIWIVILPAGVAVRIDMHGGPLNVAAQRGENGVGDGIAAHSVPDASITPCDKGGNILILFSRLKRLLNGTSPISTTRQRCSVRA
jgi:hypothetical protein